MDTTRRTKSTSRSTYLPNITSHTVESYAQHYQHMTKIANYNQMNEAQIWKEYEKLRMALKMLNEEVLRHMQRKAQTNLYAKEPKKDPNVQVSLDLLEGEKRSNETRLQVFITQKNSLEARVENLTNRKDYLMDMKHQIEIVEARIKQLSFENKQLKRRQKLVSRDLMSGASFLEKLLFEEQMLQLARKKFNKYQAIYKESARKVKEFTEKSSEFQGILQARVHQYKEQEDYIAEEQNLERFEQLQSQKNQIAKYDSIYKRNYLMKLKELENLVGSISKHDQIINETEANILNMRVQIDTISSMVSTNSRKRHSVSVMQEPKKGSKSARRSILLDASLESKEQDLSMPLNDKNQPAFHYS